MKLNVTNTYGGKFGEVIEGEYDGIYFKAKATNKDGRVILKEIETESKEEVEIAKELKWCGYVD